MTHDVSYPSVSAHRLTSIQRVRDDVNALLKTVFEARRKLALALSPRYAALWKAAETYVLAGGKRVRPYLTVAGYQLYDGQQYDKIIHVAAAQEMLNQALLMHDDIIDRDYVRYGIPNVAGQLKDYYQNVRGYSEEQSRHYADAGAMLAGDLCISEAFVLLREAGFGAEQTAGLQTFLHEAMFTVAGGELLDSETFGARIEDTNPLAIAHHKTAIYSVVVPLLSGAFLGGASDEDLQHLRNYGEKLGVAYQLADDLLGVFGDDAVTGKTTIGDLREGKHTYMMQQTWTRASAFQRAQLDTMFGSSDLSEDEADVIREIIISSGAKKAVDEMIGQYVTEAIESLEYIDADEMSKQVLRDFCVSATRRDK